MALGKEFQAKVKNSGNVLIGVAQVRVGKPSVRPAGVAVIDKVMEVATSTVVNGVVIPDASPILGGLAIGTLSGGDYTGAVDGTYILRHDGTTNLDVYGPSGAMTTIDATAALTAAVVAEGVTISGDFTACEVGNTYVIPVWSAAAQNNSQTQIISPYSMFAGSKYSVGGLKSASFTPAIDDVKTLESGFPAEVDDRVVAKTSVSAKFEALEYTNDVISGLKDMISSVINESTYSAVPLEIVMRTRGNDLLCFWIPNANLTALPDIAPTDDYSTLAWELGGSKMTQEDNPLNDAAIALRNLWLEKQFIYRELTYVH